MSQTNPRNGGKPGKRGRPATGRKPSVTIFARVNPQLGAALQDHVDSIKPKTTMSAVLALALENYLTELGLWPPADASDPKD